MTDDDLRYSLEEALPDDWLQPERQRMVEILWPIIEAELAERDAALAAMTAERDELLAACNFLNEQVPIVEDLLAAATKERAVLRERVAEDNAVCLCGCPLEDHEADACGETCANDLHDCLRVSPAVQKVYLGVVAGCEARAQERDARDAMMTDMAATKAALRREARSLRETLQSIANSACCGGCQEAALVAKSVLARLAEPPKEDV